MRIIALLLFCLSTSALRAEDLGAMWGTAEEENKYYKLVSIPIPNEIPLKVGSFDIHPDGRLIAGSRKGDVYFIDGAFDKIPAPKFHLFASGQDDRFSQDACRFESPCVDFGVCESRRSRLFLFLVTSPRNVCRCARAQLAS
jgi:hypothetical protein